MATESPVAAGLWFAGEDHFFDYTVVDSTGAAVNITGWTMEWDLRDAATMFGNKRITKTTLGGIAIISGPAGTLRVTVTADDTKNLPPRTYFDTLWRTGAGTRTVLAFGSAVLSAPAYTG